MVIAHKNQEALDEIIQQLAPGFKRGTSEYMSFYQKALTRLCKRQGDKKMENARLTAVRWNKMSQPADVQAK